MPFNGVDRSPQRHAPATPEKQASFEERREEGMAEIMKYFKVFKNADKSQVVGGVMCWSLEDGLELGERLRLTPEEYQDTVFRSGSGFPERHRKVLKELTKRLEAQGVVLPPDDKIRKMPPPTGDEPRKLYDFYVELVAQREPLKIKEEDPPGIPKAVRMGQAYLESIEPVLRGTYYTAPIKERFPQLAQDPRFSDATIEELTLEIVLHTHYGDALARDMMEQLKPARVVAYTQIEAMQRRAAKTELLKHLKSQLLEGEAIELNPKTNRYEIKWEEGGREAKCIPEEEAVRELWQLYDKGASADLIVWHLSGFDSEEAWKLRERLQAEGCNVNSLLEGLAGIDSDRAWNFRNSFLTTYSLRFIAESLSGLDSPRAWEMRGRLSNPSKNTDLLHSLAGVDSSRAWALRRKAFHQWSFVEKYGLGYSLVGLDSAEAHRLREALYNDSDVMPEVVVRSLIGLDSESAWDLRMRILKDRGMNVVLPSIAGLDSERAWEIREALIRKGSVKDVLANLAGLDSERAREFRNDLIEEDIPSEELQDVKVESLNGDNSTVIGLHANRTSPETPLARHHRYAKRDSEVELLNIVHDPTLKELNTYQFLLDASVMYENNPRKRELEHSQLAARFTTTFDLNDPEGRKAIEDYLAYNPAVPDRAPKQLADELFRRIFPQREVKTPLMERFVGWFKRSGSKEQMPVAFAAADFSTYELNGGGTERLSDTRKVLEARDEIHGLLVTGVYGTYNKQERKWEKTYFPVPPTTHEPTRETTFTLQDVADVGRASLPLPLEGQLITERVKGITVKGKEIPLTTVTNSLGEASVEVPSGVKKLAYSVELPLTEAPIADPDDREFKQFIKSFSKNYGEGLTDPLARLPPEITMRLRSDEFKKLSPKDKVFQIETWSRELGYYDAKNEEVSDKKQGKEPEEQIRICQERLAELQKKKKDSSMNGKAFAGVCADYALITCSMLRAAGIPAGILAGIGMNGKEAKMSQLHATAFVPWPDGKGGIRILSVDGTPASVDSRVQAAAQPSLEEREQGADKHLKAEQQEAEEVIEKILEAAKVGDEAAIRKLTNGKLEHALNVILHYEVKRPHLQALSGMLDAYWYGGIQRLDHHQADIELRKAMEDMLMRTREKTEASQAAAGTQLLETVRSFLAKFKKGGAISSREEGFELLNHIADLAKGELSDVERRALTAVIEYLKAKKVQ